MKLPKNGISKIVVERVQGHKLGVTTKAIIETVKKSHKDASDKQIKKALDNCVQRGFLIRTKKGRYKARIAGYNRQIKRISAKETLTHMVEEKAPIRDLMKRGFVIRSNKVYHALLGSCVLVSIVVSALISTLLGAM